MVLVLICHSAESSHPDCNIHNITSYQHRSSVDAILSYPCAYLTSTMSQGSPKKGKRGSRRLQVRRPTARGAGYWVDDEDIAIWMISIHG